ncbi:MAG: serine/threonine kinase PknH [Solirubrobacteraceae bacterium]|jgi:serine/threonine-protein kinase|nr:serine/threonine kinase PknH [Solirubrobacteraceae bacterium]
MTRWQSIPLRQTIDYDCSTLGINGAAIDDRIGTRVGRYHVDALVGVGGMSKVYAATAEDGERVALKIVKPEFAYDDDFRRRFAREAHIAGTVQNPHVVPVLSAGEVDGIPYLAQRYIEGESLEEKLRRVGKISMTEAVRIVSEVASGLHALSEAGMVHRDVKPGNILLDLQERAYVTDFGLAKDTNDVPLTEPGSSLGSLAYMAPEQIRGEAVTPSADIYSLGCVVYECVQGHPPFGEREGMKLLWAHLSEQPAAADQSSPAFSAALLLALAKTPEERPNSCVDYARALADSLDAPA